MGRGLRRRWVLGVLAATVSAVPALGQSKASLTLLTARPGSLYERAGQAFRKVLQPQGFDVVVKESPGSMFNLEQLAQGKADLALAQMDAFVLFKQQHTPRRARVDNLTVIGPVNEELVHLLVRPGIRSLGQLRGKRIGVGPQDSGTYVSALLVLQMADLDVTRERLVTGEIRQGVRELQAGQLDALFVTAGIGAPQLQAIPAGAPVELLALDQALLNQAKNNFPEAAALYQLRSLPARTYPWQSRPVTTLATYSYLFARRSLPQALVYRLTQTLARHQQALRQAHPFWALLTLDRRQETFAAGLTYHPGVQQYLNEQKVPR
ncbi:MAG: TAXI family TRAP transporter solute-binding subunit [Gloeomargarita sp. SKYBB_i_bin120]|nr:TAXI family TRAP transporter solute-binding subunit [Gloeomargarita sp. SKYG98]MCS7292454.1 TAXI family TRAP transporter solute-binding subunit [Gloeomargarita sp. SKYB120]MDW8178015.1 TAXI family TRAP transporter solute-binding subunit [Gloeomargarita sp. SKYBB_i_bin120]